MKRVLTIALVVLLLCACSREDYSSRRIQLADSQVVAYYIDKPIHDVNQGVFPLVNKMPYSLDWYMGNTDLPPNTLCRVTVEKVQNIEMLYNYVVKEKPPAEDDGYSFWVQHSLVTVKVDEVLMDPRENPLMEGDRVTVYSTNNSNRSYDKPVLLEGDQYYLTMIETDLQFPPSFDSQFFASSYYRQMSQYFCVACEEYRWKIDADGSVYAVQNLLPHSGYKTVYIGDCWYEVYYANSFDRELKELLPPYQYKWEGAEILDSVEAEKRLYIKDVVEKRE